jgi:hypothetical protein
MGEHEARHIKLRKMNMKYILALAAAALFASAAHADNIGGTGGFTWSGTGANNYAGSVQFGNALTGGGTVNGSQAGATFSGGFSPFLSGAVGTAGSQSGSISGAGSVSSGNGFGASSTGGSTWGGAISVGGGASFP